MITKAYLVKIQQIVATAVEVSLKLGLSLNDGNPGADAFEHVEALDKLMERGFLLASDAGDTTHQGMFYLLWGATSDPMSVHSARGAHFILGVANHALKTSISLWDSMVASLQ